MKFYVHQKSKKDDTFLTTKCKGRESLLWWQKQGLQYTASGYGTKIPTHHMVFFAGKWRRIYCRIFSNIGTCYIVPPKGCEDFTFTISDCWED